MQGQFFVWYDKIVRVPDGQRTSTDSVEPGRQQVVHSLTPLMKPGEGHIGSTPLIDVEWTAPFTFNMRRCA
jgi:hypothetical protein